MRLLARNGLILLLYPSSKSYIHISAPVIFRIKESLNIVYANLGWFSPKLTENVFIDLRMNPIIWKLIQRFFCMLNNSLFSKKFRLFKRCLQVFFCAKFVWNNIDNENIYDRFSLLSLYGYWQYIGHVVIQPSRHLPAQS